MDFSITELLDAHTFLGIYFLTWGCYWFISMLLLDKYALYIPKQPSSFFSHHADPPCGFYKTTIFLIEPIFKICFPLLAILCSPQFLSPLTFKDGFFNPNGVAFLRTIIMYNSFIRSGFIDIMCHFTPSSLSKDFSIAFLVFAFVEHTLILKTQNYTDMLDQHFHHIIAFGNCITIVAIALNYVFYTLQSALFFRVVSLLTLGSFYVQTSDALFAKRQLFNTDTGILTAPLIYCAHLGFWSSMLFTARAVIAMKYGVGRPHNEAHTQGADVFDRKEDLYLLRHEEEVVGDDRERDAEVLQPPQPLSPAASLSGVSRHTHRSTRSGSAAAAAAAVTVQ